MKLAITSILLLFLATLLSCAKSPKELMQTAQTPAKRYHLKGKVVSIDKQSKMVNVDSETIPDFMEAMTMLYYVKPEGEADNLAPGDAITADVVVQDEKSWLENITVTRHAPVPTSK